MSTQPRPRTAIVLAAGQGTRMRSDLPKPLHQVAGRSMIDHILGTLGALGLDRVVVVVGHGAQQMIDEVTRSHQVGSVSFAEQLEQRGTGHAVQVALASCEPLAEDELVMVLPGDAPLIRPRTLATLIGSHVELGSAASILTAHLEDPTGYGRVVRGVDGDVTGIVEQADATESQRAIHEINTSMYCFDRRALVDALGDIDTDNAQGELYLTDVISVLRGQGRRIGAVMVDDATEAQGVNDPEQLASVEAIMTARI